MGADERRRLADAARRMIFSSDFVRRDPRLGEMLTCMGVADKFRQGLAAYYPDWERLENARIHHRFSWAHEL